MHESCVFVEQAPGTIIFLYLFRWFVHKHLTFPYACAHVSAVCLVIHGDYPAKLRVETNVSRM